MSDWADKQAEIIVAGIRHSGTTMGAVKDTAKILRDTRNAALEEAAKCASVFAINQPNLHPDLSWEKTNEVSKHAAHISAQLIAETIRNLKEQNP